MTPQQLKDARLALGLSRAELAAQLGVKPRTVVSWEYGENKPSGAVLVSLARLMELEVMRGLIARSSHEGTRK